MCVCVMVFHSSSPDLGKKEIEKLRIGKKGGHEKGMEKKRERRFVWVCMIYSFPSPAFPPSPGFSTPFFF